MSVTYPPSSRPPAPQAYRRVADQFRDRIASGDLAPGQQLPTEEQIGRDFGVSRQTVRNGLALLINEGLIVADRPRGHFVRSWERMVYRPQAESQPHPVTAEMDRYATQISSEGRVPSQRIGVRIIQASQLIADRLGVSVGALVVVRERERLINGLPVNLCDSHHRLDDVQDSPIMDPADVPRGTNQVLTELGLVQDRAIDRFTARMPTPEESHRLGMHPGTATPVIVHVCTGYTRDGRPVRCTVNVLPADRHEVVYERTFDERMWES